MNQRVNKQFIRVLFLVYLKNHQNHVNLIDLARGRNILQVLTTAHQQPCLLGHDSRVRDPDF